MEKIIISTSDFRSSCLKFLEDVNYHNHSYVVTKNGKPIAQVLPINNFDNQNSKIRFGKLKGKVFCRKTDDLLSANASWNPEGELNHE